MADSPVVGFYLSSAKEKRQQDGVRRVVVFWSKQESITNSL
jgi:hypothetical protein